MMTKAGIEEMKEQIEFYAESIEKINPENIWEMNVEEFNEVTNVLTLEIVEQTIKNRIKLFYSKLGSFYPFLEAKAVDFFEFLQKYKEEMQDWYHRELEAFEENESIESVYKIYCELFDMKEEKVDSWYDNEFDSCSWREVYLSKANNVVFLIDEGGYGNDIAILDPEWDVNDIVKRLKAGEPLRKILNDY